MRGRGLRPSGMDFSRQRGNAREDRATAPPDVAPPPNPSLPLDRRGSTGRGVRGQAPKLASPTLPRRLEMGTTHLFPAEAELTLSCVETESSL
jgi:hypothetical protein